ncbi:MAG: ATP-binding protein [Bacteroidales bacterium]
MIGKIHTNYLKRILLVVGALLLSSGFFALQHTRLDVEDESAGFQKAFLKRDLLVQEALEDFVAQYQQREDSLMLESGSLDHLEEQYERDGLVYLRYNLLGEPVFWSHNAVPFDQEQFSDALSGTIRLQNGWYYFRKKQTKEGVFYVFALIRHNFKYQNRFLVNDFHSDFPVPDHVFSIVDKQQQGIPIFDTDGKYALSLQLRRETALEQNIFTMWLLSVTFGVLAFLIFIFVSFRYFSRLFRLGYHKWAIFGFIGVTVGFRAILFVFDLPEVFQNGKLFSPALYASSDVLPSLGDLFLNVLIFSVISYFLFHHLKNIVLKTPRRLWTRRLLATGLFGMIYLICELAVYLIKGLVINSHLNLNINFIFNIDVYSLVGFLIIGCIFFSFFFLSIVICRFIESILGKRSRFWALFFISLVLFASVQWIVFQPNVLQWMLFVAAIIVYEMERKSPVSVPGFTSLVSALFLFSLISTFAIYRYNSEKEHERRKSFAIRMASEQDPVAEFLFQEIQEALFNDNQLKNLVWRDPFDEPAVYQYLQHHYFYDFWNKYDMQITICMPGEVRLILPQNIEMECNWFFEDYINNYGKPTISDELIYLDNNTGRNSYITKIPVVVGENQSEQAVYNIYIEFDSKSIPRDMGFPELLIDQQVDMDPELINYSYAVYKNGSLINKYGPHNYSISIDPYGDFDQEFETFVFDDYHHLMFRKNEELQIIISRPEEAFLEKIAPFSYLFVLFFALVVVFWLLTSQQQVKGIFRMNFKRRVQFSMIGIVIAATITIGGASTLFIYNIYQNKNVSFISEKSHSVLVEMELLLSDQEVLDENWNYYLSDMLLNFSNIFFTDINIYDPDGILLASSRPKVFEEGLISTYMNPLALGRLRNLQKSQHIHSESIGNLEYLSAYMPLRNNQNNLLAYINLPYFAKQSELRNEVSYFLVAFINIYLLLMVGAILLALFISNYVTSPLVLIRDNMARVQLGRTNRKIEWNREDEIGSLINEYNRMIDELAISADLLARSERESAWREMAKQVAHEIKNPLTPMRLSVQYLAKAWKENDPEWEERLTRFSKTMVEQIDNLTVIAEAFSDFAKMPAGSHNKVDLRVFIPEVLDLYKDFEKLEITLHMEPQGHPLWIFADRNQLLRVFNNLIKNSIQAYGKDEVAQISIACRAEGAWIITEVIDYGRGIPEEQKARIFNPYFTTKTGGMGLGLNMVKNIIESFNGKVTFHSQPGKGTTFTLIIPRYDPPEQDLDLPA